MQEMKNCQFCGSDNLGIAAVHDPMRIPVKQKYVQCEHCGACGPLAKNDELAILKWNTRILEAPEMPQEEQVSCPCDIEDDDFYYCPIMNNPCIKNRCMMFVFTEIEKDGTEWGRCGLVNTMYINSTGCGA